MKQNFKLNHILNLIRYSQIFTYFLFFLFLILKNEELNNKIDLEIRILDGILKLLNAICNNSSGVTSYQALANLNTLSSASSTLSLSHSSNNLQLSNSSSHSSTPASVLISNFDANKCDDFSKCTAMGAVIAQAVMSSKIDSNSTHGSVKSSSTFNSSLSSVSCGSSSTTNSSSPFEANSTEYNHIIQILTACKCLFVSHRKIAIYLQNLNDVEKASESRAIEENFLNEAETDSDNSPSSDISHLDLIQTGSESKYNENFILKSKSMNNNDKLNSFMSSKNMYKIGALIKPNGAITNNSNSNSDNNNSNNNNNSTSNDSSSISSSDSSNLMSNENAANSSDECLKARKEIKSSSLDLLEIETCKLMLSDLRFPLSWKWHDHVKALKNSGNLEVNCLTQFILNIFFLYLCLILLNDRKRKF
jgi:trimeric autotransporter adhesin